MKKYLIAVCMLAAAVGASAQIEDDDKQLFNHLGAGVSVGMDGIGINLATTITPYVQARAGVNFLPKIQVNNIDVDMNISANDVQTANNFINQYNSMVPAAERINNIDPPRNLSMSAKLNMTDFKLLFDLYPSKTSPWRLTVGFYAGKSQFLEAWTTNCQDELQAVTDYNNLIAKYPAYAAQYNLKPFGAEIGDYIVKPDGPEARAYLKVNGFKPYVGIGSGRAISNKHRFSFAWDLGCQFWGTPTIYVQDVPLDKEGVDGDGGVIKTISKITVYPTFSFRFNGRIL